MADNCNITMFQVFSKFNHIVLEELLFKALHLGKWKIEVKRNTFVILWMYILNSLKLIHTVEFSETFKKHFVKAYKTASRTKKYAKYFCCCLFFFALFLNNGRSNDCFGFRCRENRECDSIHVHVSEKKNVTDAMFPSDYKRTTIRKKKTTKGKNILHLVWIHKEIFIWHIIKLVFPYSSCYLEIKTGQPIS